MIWILSLILVVVILIPTYVTLAFYLVWHYDRRNFQAPPTDGERDPLRGAARPQRRCISPRHGPPCRLSSGSSTQ